MTGPVGVVKDDDLCWQWYAPMPAPKNLGEYGEPTCRREATLTVATSPDRVRMCWQHARAFEKASASRSATTPAEPASRPTGSKGQKTT